MNKFTARELNKIKETIPIEFDDTTTHIIIPCVENRKVNTYNIGDKFSIRLESYIRNQPPNFTLAENWNQGTVPPEDYLDITIVKTAGKMIGVKAIGKNSGEKWEGWLPSKGFMVL